ncbi:hypothetical protein WJX77_008519 [Trebouxia sp. C0004]
MDTAVRFAFKLMVPKRTEKPADAQPTLLHAPANSSSSDSSSHHHVVLTTAGPASPGCPTAAVAAHEHAPSAAAEPAGQEPVAGCQLPSIAGRSKPVPRARSCTVCHEVDARELYCCGSCEALLHEDCTTRLPEPLDSYCLFCLDCQREPWHQGAIILAGGKAGAEGMTTNELRCAVKECRQRCVEQRAAAGTAGPKTYDGLRGDSVSFSDQFAREESEAQVQTPVANAGLSGTETLVAQTEHIPDKQMATCTEPASPEQHSDAEKGVDVPEAVVPAIVVPSRAVQDRLPGRLAPVSVVADSAVPCPAQQNSYDGQTAPGIISRSYRKLLQNHGGGKRAKPSSQKTPMGLGSACPLRTQTIPSMLKRKAQAELSGEQLRTAKWPKASTEVIDLTCEPDTPVTTGQSQVATAPPFAQDWAELSGPMQAKAVEAPAMQQDGIDPAAGDGVLDMIPLAKLDELCRDRQAMQKCVFTQLQRLRLAPVYCAKLSEIVAGGGSAKALADRMYMGFQETLRWQVDLTSVEQENDVGNYFRVFLGLRPNLTQCELA